MHSPCSRLSRLVRASTVACGCALLLVGCTRNNGYTGKLVPVQGKITMTDGKPLSGGHVAFVRIDQDPDTSAPAAPIGEIGGPIGEDGAYTLFTQGKAGAPPGKYRVALRPGRDRKTWLAVSPQYLSPKKSPLEIEVVENKPAGGYDLKVQPRK